MDKSDINDRSAKSPKKGYKFRQSTKDKTRKNKKIKGKHLASDTDSDSDYDPEEEMYILVEETDSSSEEEEEAEDFNAREFQKFVQKIFPSKGGQERVRKLEKIDKMLEKKKEIKKKKKSLTKNKKLTDINTITTKMGRSTGSRKKKKKVHKIVEESSEEDEAVEEIMRKEEAKILCEDLLDEDEKMDDNEIQDMLRQNMKVNIIFTVGQPGEEEEEDETSEEEEEEEKEEEKERECSKTSEKSKKETKKQFKKNQKVNVYYKDWDKAYIGKIKTIVAVGNNPDYSLYNIELDLLEDDEEWAIQENIKGKYITEIDETGQVEDSEILNELQELIKCRKSKGSDAMVEKFQKMSTAYKRKQNKEQKKREEKLKSKNVSTLRKLLRAPNIMNDFKYFKDMDIEAQKKILTLQFIFQESLAVQ